METVKIKGNSIFTQFINQNLDEIVERKTNIINEEKGYLYVTADGEFKEGRNDQYGQSSTADFGGYSSNKYMAIRDLQNLVNAEPFDADMWNADLQKMLK